MNIKNITASSMLVLALIFSSTMYADSDNDLSNEISENNNPEIIAETETSVIDADIINTEDDANNLEIISEEETKITEIKYTQAESFELLLQKYLDANQTKKEGLLWKLARIGTRESLLLAIPALTFSADIVLSNSISKFGEIFSSDQNKIEQIKKAFQTIYKNIKKFPNIIRKKDYREFVLKSLGAAAISYIILRSSYAIAQMGTTPTQTPNLKLLTEIVKLWEGYKAHLPEKLHQTFEILHIQYLKNKKLNMNEATAQKIINEMLQVSLNKMNEDSLAVENSPAVIA